MLKKTAGVKMKVKKTKREASQKLRDQVKVHWL